MKKEQAPLGSVQMGSVPIGTVVAFMLSLDNLPSGWLLCDGSSIIQASGTDYPTLRQLLGSDTTPNLTGRTLLGGASPTSGSPWTLNKTGGEETVTLTEDQMPSHQHFGWGEKGNNPWGTGTSNDQNYYGCHSDDNDNHLFGSTFSGGVYSENTVGNTNGTVTATTKGSNNSHDNMQPYYVAYYIIYAGTPS